MSRDQFVYKMYHVEIKLYLNEMIMTTIKKIVLDQRDLLDIL